MPLLEMWKESPDQLRNKHIQQLIAFAGAGRLLDESPCSKEFRTFLAGVPSASLFVYSNQCLSESFDNSGMALQDIVNEVGTRLGASVTPGRYRGTSKHLGFDGLWAFPNGHSIIIEVKTTDTYRITLETVAAYRKGLVASESVIEAASSMLFVVGRQDTGDMEAQVRGSRYALDIRIISVDALLRLMSIKEEVEDPAIVKRIHNILIPHDFIRLDAIADVLFSAAEDIREEEGPAGQGDEADGGRSARAEPVAFHEACVQRVQLKIGAPFVKRSRAGYSTPDQTVALNCAVSKEYDPDTRPNYWFAFHPHQQEFLHAHAKPYVVFGCGSSARMILIPFQEFQPWLKGMSTTTKGDRTYWHVLIYRTGSTYTLRRKKGEKAVDLTPYVVPEGS